MARKENIDRILRDWPYDPQGISVRKKKGDDGRDVLQMRLDLGLLQLETTGRPDGQQEFVTVRDEGVPADFSDALILFPGAFFVVAQDIQRSLVHFVCSFPSMSDTIHECGINPPFSFQAPKGPGWL